MFKVALFDAAAVSRVGIVVDAEDECDLLGDIFYVSALLATSSFWRTETHSSSLLPMTHLQNTPLC